MNPEDHPLVKRILEQQAEIEKLWEIGERMAEMLTRISIPSKYKCEPGHLCDYRIRLEAKENIASQVLKEFEQIKKDK